MVEKYLTKGKSKLYLSFYATSGDGLDIHRFPKKPLGAIFDQICFVLCNFRSVR